MARSRGAQPGTPTDVLYISHNGLTEPLGRRQVLPYIKGLALRGWRFRVITFEKSSSTSAAVKLLRLELAGLPVDWRALTYHNSPPRVSTAFDFLHGITRSALGSRARMIHARSSLPALMAATLAGAWRVPWIFDVRGFLAEEYADAGHWRRHAIVYRLTQMVEKWLLRRASAAVLLTHRALGVLAAQDPGITSRPHEVIPCAVDLDTFRPDPGSRARIRQRLRIDDSGSVLAYAGSLGSWYRFAEMLDFFTVARGVMPDLVFLVLTPQPDVALAEITRRGLDAHTRVLQVTPEDVPPYLAASDAGICFLADVPSKAASSPTKYGEYLASGLAVVTTGWTGDVGRYRDEIPWLVVDGLSKTEYERAAVRLAALLASRDDLAKAARSHAMREFGLDKAVSRYEELYTRLIGHEGNGRR